MEFYKEGKVLPTTANTRLDLGGSQFNHKAAMVLSDGDCKLEFYTKGAISGGVTFAAGGLVSVPTSSFTNAIIPARLAAVTTVSTGQVILFN